MATEREVGYQLPNTWRSAALRRDVTNRGKEDSALRKYEDDAYWGEQSGFNAGSSGPVQLQFYRPVSVGSSYQTSTSYPSGSVKNTYGSPGQNSPRCLIFPPARSITVTALSMSRASASRKPKCLIPPDSPTCSAPTSSTRTSWAPGVCAWRKCGWR